VVGRNILSIHYPSFILHTPNPNLSAGSILLNTISIVTIPNQHASSTHVLWSRLALEWSARQVSGC
jgi:hypothetical protein